ncbi:hypothetical protein D9F58_08275 [Escherichia coli]|nr:hypothetical protein [Escherichia coli]EQN92555.1 hypothetical protein G701_02801 [Escherichia coli HVH 25 (4-5851939)]MGJ62522.1 hypothetical protein [Escherichia coli]MGJ99995.1 hypothetical protein [Escherichia coli]TYE35599.1 hypothetical protein DJ486_09235 [Escherichia coli]
MVERSMDIWSFDKLFIFIIFVVPGFISIKVYEALHPSVKKESSKIIIDAVAYSCINYAIWFFPIYFAERNNLFDYSLFLYYLMYFLAFFISPSLLPVALYKLRESQFFRNKLPHPVGRPWDFFFRNAPACWVIITLKDGKKIGGLYAGNAFASSSPEPEQIYLIESWHINDDGGFDRPKERTLGVLVLTTDVLTVEFYSI